MDILLLLVNDVLMDMEVGVVFAIVENDVVVEHHWLPVLPVVVPLLDVEADSLGGGVRAQLDEVGVAIQV